MNPFSRKRLAYDKEISLANNLIKQARFKNLYPLYQTRVALVIDPYGPLIKSKTEQNVCFTGKIPILFITNYYPGEPQYAVLAMDTDSHIKTLLERAGLPYEISEFDSDNHTKVSKTYLTDAEYRVQNTKVIINPKQGSAAKLTEKSIDLLNIQSVKFVIFQEVALDDVIESHFPDDYESLLLGRMKRSYVYERLKKRYSNWEEMWTHDDHLEMLPGGASSLYHQELETLEQSHDEMRFVKQRVEAKLTNAKEGYEKDQDFINLSSIDIVISSPLPDLIPYLLIEYDGDYHLDEYQQVKDRRKERISAMAGLPLIRITLSYIPPDEEIGNIAIKRNQNERQRRSLFVQWIIVYLVEFMQTVDLYESITFHELWDYNDGSVILENSYIDDEWNKLQWARESEHKFLEAFQSVSDEMWHDLKSQTHGVKGLKVRRKNGGTFAEVAVQPSINSKFRVYETPVFRLSGRISGIFVDTTPDKLEELFCRRHVISLALNSTRLST